MRLDANDRSANQGVIRHMVDAVAETRQVRMTEGSTLIAQHERCEATATTITEPAHRTHAASLHSALQTQW